MSELKGRVGDYRAQIAKSEQAKASAEATLASIDLDWQSDVATQLQDAQLQLAEVENQITSAKDVLDRLTVRAPQDGVIANIQFRTPGSAIPAGQPIMDVVPEKEQLLVEAKLGTREIVNVHVGGKAQVRLTAYDHRVIPPVDGKIIYVAADQTIDPNSQNAYYVIRASIDAAELEKHTDREPLSGYAGGADGGAQAPAGHRLSHRSRHRELQPRLPRELMRRSVRRHRAAVRCAISPSAISKFESN